MTGYVKVSLQYLTQEPQHLRSILLSQHGIKPPYIEETCVLLPHEQVFPLLECFLPAFESLRKSGAIPGKSELQGYRILDRDSLTLSYVL
jgi:hypothetical protein